MNLEQYSRSDLERAIDEWVILKRHSERNRQILKRYMLDGIPFEPLSEEFGLSPRQVQNIIYSIEKILLKNL